MRRIPLTSKINKNVRCYYQSLQWSVRQHKDNIVLDKQEIYVNEDNEEWALKIRTPEDENNKAALAVLHVVVLEQQTNQVSQHGLTN